MKRLIPYVLYLLLLAMHQVIWKDITNIHTASINLTALMVVLVAVYKFETTVLWWGFISGLVVAAGVPESIGWQALVLAMIGLVAYHIRERLNLDSLTAKLFLVFGCILFHNICTLIINHMDAFLYRLFANALAGAVYTTVIAWLFFLVKEGRINRENIKSLF